MLRYYTLAIPQMAAQVLLTQGAYALLGIPDTATGLRTLSYETALAYTRGITIEELRAGYAKTSTTPMGRSGKLTEVANTVAFLLSDRASYVDGVTLNIAGGKTRG